MRSNIYTLKKLKEDFSNIPAEAEKVANYNDLDKKSALRLRLLAEELVGMLPKLLIYGSGSFWIENEGNDYELHLEVTPYGDNDFDRKKVLSVSSSGKNAASRGIVNKITLAAEKLFNHVNKVDLEDPYSDWTMGLTYKTETPFWSLTDYKTNIAQKKKYTEQWDELEKSIIANLADDVLVGIINGHIDIVIKKKF